MGMKILRNGILHESCHNDAAGKKSVSKQKKRVVLIYFTEFVLN
ncbi:hypothetical protein [Gracilibacillus oryzae]|nr:hypothetical protein [Gracilibacillus oryzae]